MLFMHCVMQIYLFYWLFEVTVINNKTQNYGSGAGGKKRVFYHFYHPDLHIYINIWSLCIEKVEVDC